jgi:hypothetical protein
MRANSANSLSVSRSHIWQAAQKYCGAPPIASWRRSSRATRSELGILKSSIALLRVWWQGEERSSWYDEVKARFGVLTVQRWRQYGAFPNAESLTLLF